MASLRAEVDRLQRITELDAQAEQLLRERLRSTQSSLSAATALLRDIEADPAQQRAPWFKRIGAVLANTPSDERAKAERAVLDAMVGVPEQTLRNVNPLGDFFPAAQAELALRAVKPADHDPDTEIEREETP